LGLTTAGFFFLAGEETKGLVGLEVAATARFEGGPGMSGGSGEKAFLACWLIGKNWRSA